MKEGTCCIVTRCNFGVVLDLVLNGCECEVIGTVSLGEEIGGQADAELFLWENERLVRLLVHVL